MDAVGDPHSFSRILAGDDESAQEENGQREKLLFNEKQAVQHAARAAIAIGKWMDGLELLVSHGHADERVDVAGPVFPMQEPLPVGKQTADPVLTCGGV